MIRTRGYLMGFPVRRRLTRRIGVVAFWIITAGVFGRIFFGQFGWTSGGLSAFLIVWFFLFSDTLGGTGSGGGALKPFSRRRRRKQPGFQTLFRGELLSNELSADPDLMLDERDERIRDRAHFLALTFTRRLGLLLFAVSVYLVIKQSTNLWRDEQAFLFGLVLVMWNLPQSLILWAEPDLEANPEAATQ